ncbi:MAG: NAD(P) transhydrogenase subunit alpha [Shewanellaceae bacterium]|nr:NAD(P) transhydrogenase subunit alpha [Shewanellaceae bacterium]
MKIGLLKELKKDERCVALTPQDVAWLIKNDFSVSVQSGTGSDAQISDQDYLKVGAEVLKTQKQILDQAQIIIGLNLHHSLQRSIKYLQEKHILVSMFDPFNNIKFLNKLNKQRTTVFALEMLPRITRAQSMDVLSTIGTIAGYQAVISAADLSPQLLPMMITAAGTLSPARVLVIGAGVAGLQACATAKRLGAIVEAYDVREATQEQIISVGAKPVSLNLIADNLENSQGYANEPSKNFLKLQQQGLEQVLLNKDIVITTASIPGKKAPILMTEDMIEKMKKGSVIIDLAAASGGNTELTEVGEIIEYEGITIVGIDNITSYKSLHASQMFGNNIRNFINLLQQNTDESAAFKDDILLESCICQQGQFINQSLKKLAKKVKETV